MKELTYTKKVRIVGNSMIVAIPAEIREALKFKDGDMAGIVIKKL